MATKSFHIADYILFGITILASIVIGFYYAFVGGKQKTTSEFHLGNRKMSILPVAISLVVSFESSIMMLGAPAETYVYGIQVIMGTLGYFVADLLAIKIMVPLIHPLKITSTYEYLELRFQSRAVRLLGTVLGMLNYALYMGIVLFGPAIALEAVMGVPQYVSIVIVAVAAVIYTSLGGLKAVIWTDVFQGLVMICGLLAILIKGTIVSGGVKPAWETASDQGRLNFFIWDTDITRRHTFWNLFVGSIIRGIGFIFNQSSVQRIVSIPTLKDARRKSISTYVETISTKNPKEFWEKIRKLGPRGGKSVPMEIIDDSGNSIFDEHDVLEKWREEFENLYNGSNSDEFDNYISISPRVMMIAAPTHVIALVLACSEGIVAYAFYHTLRCDPLKSKQISNPNQIIPFMVMDIFERLPGMPGLFMASLFSASLSTLSSGLSSLSALFWHDVVKPHTKPMSELKATIISKIAVIVFGVVAILIAFLVSLIGGPLTQITVAILAFTGGPLAGLFLLGCVCPWANSKGAFVGTLSGIALIIWITTGQYTANVRKAVPLPSAPIEQCYIQDINSTSMYNTTMSMMTHDMTTDIMSITEAPVAMPSGIDYFYSISYRWFDVIGIFTVLIVGGITSLLTGHTRPEQSNPRYLVCIVDEILFFLPKPVRTFLKFGYNYEKPKVCDEDETVYNKTILISEPETDLQQNDGKLEQITKT